MSGYLTDRLTGAASPPGGAVAPPGRATTSQRGGVASPLWRRVASAPPAPVRAGLLCCLLVAAAGLVLVARLVELGAAPVLLWPAPRGIPSGLGSSVRGCELALTGLHPNCDFWPGLPLKSVSAPPEGSRAPLGGAHVSAGRRERQVRFLLRGDAPSGRDAEPML